MVLLATGGALVLANKAQEGPITGKTAKAKGRCHGISHAQVRGTTPTYTRKKLARYPNHKRVCRGLWMPKPRRHFVPQGLAIGGRTAWVSGFRYRKGYGNRPCQLRRIDLSTGRLLARHTAIVGRVGNRPRTFCRHGGGLLRRGGRLWLAESSKLWLVDPSQQGAVLNARRAWRIEAPVRGSAIVATRTRIGLVPFQKKGSPRIYWYDFKKLMKPRVRDLATRSAGRSQLGAVSSTRVPRLVQGAARDTRGRLFLSRSNLSCGELVTPSGHRMALVPGVEGIQFGSSGKRLWAVSESGSRPYSRLGKPMTPVVSSFEWPGLLHGRRATCLPRG